MRVSRSRRLRRLGNRGSPRRHHDRPRLCRCRQMRGDGGGGGGGVAGSARATNRMSSSSRSRSSGGGRLRRRRRRWADYGVNAWRPLLQLLRAL